MLILNMPINVTLGQIHDRASPRNLTNFAVHILGEPSWPWQHNLSSVDMPPKEPVFT